MAFRNRQGALLKAAKAGRDFAGSIHLDSVLWNMKTNSGRVS
jgi:hypothetical protein